MLKIRLTRMGKKHEPHYRIVVAPKENPVKGQYLTALGTYNPQRQTVTIDTEKAMEWLNKGAIPSNRIARLLLKSGVKHKSIMVKEFHTKPKKDVTEDKPAVATEALAPDETPEASPEAELEKLEVSETETQVEESKPKKTKTENVTEEKKE